MEYMFLPLRRYADFGGRSRRMEFWMWQVLQVGIYIVFLILLFALGGSALMLAGGDPAAGMAAGGAILAIGLLYFVVWLALLIPSIAVAVRRLHDTDRSGWWVTLPILPYLILYIGGTMQSGGLSLIGLLTFLPAAIVLIVFYFLDGTPGPNRFGEDPKGRGAAETFA